MDCLNYQCAECIGGAKCAPTSGGTPPEIVVVICSEIDSNAI